MSKPYVSRVKATVTVIVVCISITALGFVLLVESQLRRPLQFWADSRATNLATLAINRAIERAISNEIGSVDLVRPLKDATGLAGLSYAWSDLARIKVAVTEAVVESVESVSTTVIPVPLGELTGMGLFAALGPTLPVRIIPVGAVKTDMRFNYEAKGINQVLHRIYVDVQVNMRVVVPFLSTDIAIHEQVPVTTEWIQGNVPDAMINWAGSIEDLQGKQSLP